MLWKKHLPSAREHNKGRSLALSREKQLAMEAEKMRYTETPQIQVELFLDTNSLTLSLFNSLEAAAKVTSRVINSIRVVSIRVIK